jgi:hypothetical protein
MIGRKKIIVRALRAQMGEKEKRRLVNRYLIGQKFYL